jgi:prephenate dehydrogenase
MEPDRAAAVARLPDRIAFLGLGLIGGSAAMALREAGYAGSIAAWTPQGRGPAEALRRDLVQVAAPTPAEAVAGAGLVILAGPPLAIMDQLARRGSWVDALAPGATVTDVASTKVSILAAAAGLPSFIGGHPMAGRETTGIEAASAELFEGRLWVITVRPEAMNEHAQRVQALAGAAGARPTFVGAEEHDAAVAAISHLPLVLSAALVETVTTGKDWPLARHLTAGGWRDMSRLAKGDPEMGAGILATNAEEIRDRLHALRGTLDAWIDELDGASPDPAPLRTRLERARAALDTDARR